VRELLDRRSLICKISRHIWVRGSSQIVIVGPRVDFSDLGVEWGAYDKSGTTPRRIIIYLKQIRSHITTLKLLFIFRAFYSSVGRIF